MSYTDLGLRFFLLLLHLFLLGVAFFYNFTGEEKLGIIKKLNSRISELDHKNSVRIHPFQ